jgi:hypothetical protein
MSHRSSVDETNSANDDVDVQQMLDPKNNWIKNNVDIQDLKMP